jgi:hypothetical protein
MVHIKAPLAVILVFQFICKSFSIHDVKCSPNTNLDYTFHCYSWLLSNINFQRVSYLVGGSISKAHGIHRRFEQSCQMFTWVGYSTTLEEKKSTLFVTNIYIISYRAAVTAAIEPGITGIGVQYMFLAIGIVLMSSSLLLWVIQRHGPTWRRRRAELE